ncbi:MAG: DUF3142 domain-containing protein [Cyanobacteriota/Melainabacteria group bacterium]
MISAIVSLASLIVISGSTAFCRSSKNSPRPALMLWAWELPHRIDFIDENKGDTGVAYLAQTLVLTGAEWRRKPRLQPLLVPDGTYLEAVSRIEIDRRLGALYSEEQLEGLVGSIVQTAGRPGTRSIQIDFDCARSKRGFYKKLVKRIRSRLPADTELTITCLASWVVGDYWLSDLREDVDQVVPMFFRMGAGRRAVLSHIGAGRSLACSGHSDDSVAFGFSVDEVDVIEKFKSCIPKQLSGDRRVYLFSPGLWNKRLLSKVKEEIL